MCCWLFFRVCRVFVQYRAPRYPGAPNRHQETTPRGIFAPGLVIVVKKIAALSFSERTLRGVIFREKKIIATRGVLQGYYGKHHVNNQDRREETNNVNIRGSSRKRCV